MTITPLRKLLVVALLLLITPLPRPTLAQAPLIMDAEIMIFYDQASLTLVLAQQPAPAVDLSGLALVLNGSEFVTLSSYPTFQALTFDLLPTPVCLQFVVTGQTVPPPDGCLPESTFTQVVAVDEVFWFDAARGTLAPVVLANSPESLSTSDTAWFEICTGLEAVCTITYPLPLRLDVVVVPSAAAPTQAAIVPTLPLAPTLTPSPRVIATSVPTASPTPTPTLTTTPTATVTMTPTATPTPTASPTITPTLTPTEALCPSAIVNTNANIFLRGEPVALEDNSNADWRLPPGARVTVLQVQGEGANEWWFVSLLTDATIEGWSPASFFECEIVPTIVPTYEPLGVGGEFEAFNNRLDPVVMRENPAEGAEPITRIAPGDTVTVLGTDEMATWWFVSIQLDFTSTIEGWVRSDLLTRVR